MKKLLIITQKVDQNDDLLGFFHDWIDRLSILCDEVNVICLFEGKNNFRQNVRIFSLGKERGSSKVKYLVRFYYLIWKLRNNYSSVFVHMNPRYVVLGGLCWKVMGKRISLWYAHGRTHLILRLAEFFSDIIFSSTREGFRLKSAKLKIIGQGINTEKFLPDPDHPGSDFLSLISVGRIAPSKDYETLIVALGKIKNDLNFHLKIIGGISMDRDVKYFDKIIELIDRLGLKGKVKILGSISNDAIIPHLQTADCFINMGLTGSLDKAILEAMATGLVVLTCNEALNDVLGNYSPMLMYPKKDPNALAEKIMFIHAMGQGQRRQLGLQLRDIVVKEHNLNTLAKRIVDNLYG